MSEPDDFVGYWKVLDCAPVTISIDPKGIQGTIFQLSKTGDVTWKVSQDAVPTPLFKCDTYEVMSMRPYLANSVLRFGTYKGHIIACTVKTFEPYIGVISINDGWCLLVCKKFEDAYQEDPLDLPFSFLPALQDGYFSDLVVKASNNKEFRIHSCIVKLSAPEINWLAKPPPLSGLPEDVLTTILHFLYAQCLPKGLEEDTIKRVISSVSDMPGLETLVEMCHIYIRNLALKNQIFSLVAEMHTCFSQIIDQFANKNSNDYSENLTSDPARLCFAVKNSIREVAVAASKFLILCDLYASQKHQLSREEGNEIILHAISRIPVFLSQVERFFQSVKNTFSSLLPSQRQELACYLVPEVETILDTTSSLLIKVKTALEVMLTESEIEEETNSQKKLENLEDYTDNLLHRKELGRLRCVIDRITCVLEHLQQKKENFKKMTSGNKIRSVARNLEQIMEELPIFLLRAEEFTNALEEKLQWSEFQFCFKVGTSKVSEILKKLVIRKDSFQELLLELCDLVQKDAFSQGLIALGLLDSSNGLASNATSKLRKNSRLEPTTLKDSICVSPPAYRNRLSEAAERLLKSGHETDMMFEVITSGESDCVVDHTGETSLEPETETSSHPEVCKMAAHRVIIAARCDWFRRALLSGMQEDINRKIEVHNTSPYLFSLFLEYLYSGRLDFLSLSVDQISELLLLSDRYELDSLKQVCEYGLKSYLDEDSVLYLFSMADRFNAKILKSVCEQFIAQHPEVMDSDLFEELPDNLQSEIYDVIIGGKPQRIDYLSDKILSTTPFTVGDIEEMTANCHLNSDAPSPESDDIPLSQDSARLESALEQLRDIVGDDVSRSQLVQVIIAADYDINRALNFYYSSS